MTFDLPTLDPKLPVVIDTETVSGDREKDPLYPYKGTRVGLIQIGQQGKVWSYLLRNKQTDKCIPLERFLPEFRKWILDYKLFVGQNIKFDFHALGQDNIDFGHADWHDTMILGRLVNNDLMSYSLDSMLKNFGIGGKKNELKKVVTDYLKQIKSKDWGEIPPDILVPYAENDVIDTERLYHHLLHIMPEESLWVLKNDSEFNKRTFYAEKTGIQLDKHRLKIQRIKLLQTMVREVSKINKLCGYALEPDSPVQVAEFFAKERVEPVTYTEKGSPSWGDTELEALLTMLPKGCKAYDVAESIVAYKHARIAESTFCLGWLSAADDKGYIHPNFVVSGTKTGRLSSREPNVQNPPSWIMDSLLIPDGYVGIKWDLAQIEYRVFTHYAKEDWLLEAYAANPATDLHQIVADLLGMPRRPVKSINFGIIYGMGKKKLRRTIAAGVSEFDSPKMRLALQKYHAGIPQDMNEPIPQSYLEEAADAILEEYHKRIPTINGMNKQIKQAIYAKGYIRNYFGRRYQFGMDRSYIALNYLVQGSSADFFKRQCNRVLSAVPEAQMVNNIHDALMAIVPIEYAQKYLDACAAIIPDANFRVPILYDIELALYNWGNYTKVINNSADQTIPLILRG